ncbi:MAG: VWA domain-containing protein [Spirochaetaceae bacterium]|nr:MAG: VWA domain-containing protein [Spirochaetaceae bacterium]
MKIRRFFLILLVFSLYLPFSAAADEREEPIDVIIALDKSKSMAENDKIEAVKEYVNSYIIDELLIEGDFFLVVAFYGQTEIPISVTISGDEDKERAKAIIAQLLGDGVYTDIGNALDVLGEQVEKYSRPDRKKHLLLITDGIQEAPPESKYYSPDGSFNHEFLENTKTIQMKGWKVHILGVGIGEEARKLADELAGTYTDLSEQPTVEELMEKTGEFLSALEVSGPVTMAPVDYRGRSRVALSVESKGYTDERTVVISGLRLTLPDGMERNILADPASFTFAPDSTTDLAISVRIPEPVEVGDQSGSLRFEFSGEDRFLPVVSQVDYHVNSFFENFWWWMLIALAVLILLVLLIVLLARRLKKVKYRFQLVTGTKKEEKAAPVYRIKEGKPLYLEVVEGAVAVNPKRTPESIARLMAIQKGVRLTVLKSERFPKFSDAPLDILDFDFRVRLDLDKKKDITVRLARPS